jgi:hypothetical protein
MSTITPNPAERIRLITLAELLTGYMGEDMPRYIMGVLIDLVNNKVVTWKLSSVFMVMGSTSDESQEGGFCVCAWSAHTGLSYVGTPSSTIS